MGSLVVSQHWSQHATKCSPHWIVYLLLHCCSAYCGSLWLASLCCMVKMGAILNCPDVANKFSALLTKAKASFHKKLWNGEFWIGCLIKHINLYWGTIIKIYIICFWFCSLFVYDVVYLVNTENVTIKDSRFRFYTV